MIQHTAVLATLLGTHCEPDPAQAAHLPVFHVQSLAGEERRLQSTASQLERELAAREGQLAGQAGEMAALQEALRTAQAQSNQYVMDLQVGMGCLLAW